MKLFPAQPSVTIRVCEMNPCIYLETNFSNSGSRFSGSSTEYSSCDVSATSGYGSGQKKVQFPGVKRANAPGPWCSVVCETSNKGCVVCVVCLLRMLGWAWENKVIDNQWGRCERLSYKGFYVLTWYVTNNDQVLATGRRNGQCRSGATVGCVLRVAAAEEGEARTCKPQGPDSAGM